MKPPSAEACNQALDILLSSIWAENHVRLEHVSALATLGNEARLRAASCCKQRNALLPINQLPYELLEHLFRECINQDEPHGAQELHRLAQVATSWWALVKSSAPLWATIDADDPEYAPALRKAKKSPLYIHLPNHGFDLERDHAVVALIDPERDHWRSLSIYRSNAPDLIKQLLERAMPQLDYLQIETYSDLDDALPGEHHLLPSTTLPLLSHLIVQGLGFIFVWQTAPILPFLKHITIEYSTFQCAQGLLLVSFAPSPLLETLDIGILEVSYEEMEHAATASLGLLPQTISLPQLQSVTFKDVPSSWAATFIDHLHAPDLSFLYFRLTVYAPILKPLMSLRDRFSLVETMLWLASVDRVEVSVAFNDVFKVDGYQGDSVEFFLCFRSNPTTRVFMDLIEFPLLDYPEAAPINLVLNGPCLEDASLVTFLRGMPSVTKITFHSSTSLPLVEYLSNPLLDEGDGERWACPMLREVVTAKSREDRNKSEEKQLKVIKALENLVSVRSMAAMKGNGMPAEVLLRRES